MEDFTYILSTPKVEENSHHTKALKPQNSKTLKQILKNQESPLRSSSKSSFKIKPQRPLKKLPLIQDQAPTALEESVHHSSSVHPKDQAPTTLWINNIKSTHYKDRIRG
ncbi:hypothetical protein ACFX2H_044218 [Malus domestica]